MKYTLSTDTNGVTTITYGDDLFKFDKESSYIIRNEVASLHKEKRVQLFLHGVCLGTSLTRQEN